MKQEIGEERLVGIYVWKWVGVSYLLGCGQMKLVTDVVRPEDLAQASLRKLLQLSLRKLSLRKLSCASYPCTRRIPTQEFVVVVGVGDLAQAIRPETLHKLFF